MRLRLLFRVWDLLVKPVQHEELNETLSLIAWIATERDAPALSPALLASSSLRGFQLSDRPASPERTAPAILHLNEHFACRISLEKVAAACRLSPSQFCRVFRKERRVSFGQYLLYFRMNHARTLLEREDMLVKKIAYAFGFPDLSYFTRSFKRHFGVCLTAYGVSAKVANGRAARTDD
jgi:AraC-like DNA-binding protein